ncbi:MAG: DUF6644 family protein [Bryobacteraceae bacterium]
MAINVEELIFPTLECLHILGFVIAIGTSAVVDFRLLDIGFQSQTPAQLAKDTRFWMLGGLLLSIFAGLGIYSTDPDNYYENWSFLIKMVLLIAAIVFHYTVKKKAASGDTPSGSAKVIAVVSMLLWTSVIFGGIFIPFIAPGLE